MRFENIKIRDNSEYYSSKIEELESRIERYDFTEEHKSLASDLTSAINNGNDDLLMRSWMEFQIKFPKRQLSELFSFNLAKKELSKLKEKMGMVFFDVVTDYLVSDGDLTYCPDQGYHSTGTYVVGTNQVPDHIDGNVFDLRDYGY